MDPLLLRFLERIIAVLIGGMTIYLGFRLFLAVPEQRDSAGKVVLPWDTSIVMTRIGPGVFFALFGVIAVSLALLRPLDIRLQEPGSSDSAGGHLINYAAAPTLGDPTKRADSRALLRKEIAILNTIPQQLRKNLPEHEQDAIRRGIARVKLALIKPLWGNPDEGFGDVVEFERWVQAGEPDSPLAVMDGTLALYRYGTKEPNP